jgi:N-acetylglutamate synthase-like GNAT family acetyltransferase
MKIRKAKSSDLKEMSILRMNTIKRFNAKDYPKKVFLDLLRRNSVPELKIKMKKGEIFCAVDNREIIGTVGLEEDKVWGMYTKVSRQGEGIGTKLMDFLEKHAKKKGLKNLFTYSTPYAKDFYIKRGFKFKGYLNGFRVLSKKTKKFEVINIKVPILEKRLK